MNEGVWLVAAALAATTAHAQVQQADTQADPGAVTLAGVDVSVTNPPAAGTPVPRTRAAAVNPDGQALKLAFAAGDPIDAGFVRTQFERNNLVGRPVSSAMIVDMVQLISAALLAQGYVNTGVVLEPGQALADGATLRLKLIYGRLGSAASPGVTIDWGAKGKRGLTESYVRARMPSMHDGAINAAAVERDFRLLSDTPGIRSVRANLTPLDQPGEAQLALSIDPAPPLDLYMIVANNRTPSVGGERAAIGGSARNLFDSTDLLAFEVGRTSGVTDAVGTYSAPVFDYHLRLTLRAGLNNAAVIDPQLLALDISARDRFAEAGLLYTLSERPLTPTSEPGRWISARALTAGLTFVHRRTLTYLFGERFSFTPGSVRGRAEYSALRGSIDFIDRGPAQAVTFSLIGTLGLDGTRSDVPGLAQPPRNFRVVTAQANYARRLNEQRLELRARMTAQYTDKILYTAERFSVGGSTTVRGYRENLILSDRGVVGSVELAQPFSLSGRAGTPDGVDLGSFTASLFVDGAWVDNVGPVDPDPRWIAGAGASILWTPSEALTARLTYGEALKKAPQVGKRDLQDRGISFLVTVRPLSLFGYR